MTRIGKVIFYVLIIIINLNLIGCNRGTTKEEVHNKKYSDVIILEKKEDNTISIYNAEKDMLREVDKIELSSEVVYNNSEKKYVYLRHHKEDIEKNYIEILNQKGRRKIDDFYFAKDLKISPQGSKLAYRSFKGSSIDTAKGMGIIDVDKGKEIKLKSPSIVSGNLYNWIGEDAILYYGIRENKENREVGIFQYDFKDEKEEIYVKDIDGFCTYFFPIEDNLLIQATLGDKTHLYLKGREKEEVITEKIENIYDSVYDKENKKIYLIATEKYINIPSMYEIDLKDYSLEKINYDFPKEVDMYGGLKLDSNGLLYYCGISEEYGKNDVYVFNAKDRSNSIITIHSSEYNISGK
ncbi:hypothetical protein [Clostridium tetani]|uniref:hypothetical protein n=1 Tax=Clostridium tetani TaxID=1513 RepID=UPI0029538F8B|nr:hypothetical protein [Clostridium tetani]BDR75821.1 lipoprotein [Clostridium tetani]